MKTNYIFLSKLTLGYPPASQLAKKKPKNNEAFNDLCNKSLHRGLHHQRISHQCSLLKEKCWGRGVGSENM